MELEIVFIPKQEKIYEDDIIITTDAPETIETDVSGIGYDIDITQYSEEEYEYLNVDTRWDHLSIKWFSTFRYVNEIKQYNKHIPLNYRKTFYAPGSTYLLKPSIENISNIGAVSIPEWRKQ